jgi:hypothetical protein
MSRTSAHLFGVAFTSVVTGRLVIPQICTDLRGIAKTLSTFKYIRDVDNLTGASLEANLHTKLDASKAISCGRTGRNTFLYCLSLAIGHFNRERTIGCVIGETSQIDERAGSH